MANVSNSPSEWDQRQLFNKRLHELLSLADYHSVADNYDDWYDCLRGVRRMINCFLTDEEKDKSNEIDNMARAWAKVSGNSRLNTNLDVVQDKLNELHTLLYDLAHKYRLLIPVADKTAGGLIDRQ